jgi:sortase B
MPGRRNCVKRTEKVLLMVFLVVSVICGKCLLDYWQDSYDNRQNYRQVEEIAFPEKDTEDDDTESNVDNPMTAIDDFDYQALLDENADCIGWLKIDGTDISYPVVQGEDNEFYLHHDFQKNYTICGTLMLDCRNDVDARQEHLIIYGHQMKDGSMFKQLNGYKKEEYYRGHKEITLYLENQKYQYEVAAVYVTNVAQSGGYYDYLHKETRKQQMDYLQKMAAYQLYPTGVTVREEDELLSLSTCEYSSTNGRLIVLTRRIGR